MTRLALLADVHDHVAYLDRALPALAGGSDALLVLGDLVAPFVLRRIARGYPRAVHVVLGNNDGDPRLLERVAAEHAHVTLHGAYFVGGLGGVRVAAQHYPQIADALDPRRFDLIAFGHDHRARVERRGEATWVNPGALMGFDPVADATVPASFAVYDHATRACTFHRVVGEATEAFVPALGAG